MGTVHDLSERRDRWCTRYQPDDQFDVGGPNRCYRCGRKDALKVCGEGGYVWTCCDCPHPAD